MRKHEPFPAASLPDELDPAAPCLVGVSGGRDSVALLHWLHERGFSRLSVAHLDHGLRPSSAGEADFVERLARSLGLPAHTERVSVSALARRRKQSIETAAREARYRFFARIAAREGCRWLLLAHHADDQVETFLLQLFRGAGSGGLGGMAPVSTRVEGGVELTVVRPLLGVWREEIDAYVAARGLAYCEDETNAETEATRNRMRHLAIPALREAFGREIRPALWRAAEILRAEDAWLAQSDVLRAIPAQLSAAHVRALPLALQRRLIHAWMQQAGVAGIGFAEVEAARGLLSGRTAKANLPGGRCVRRRSGVLFLDTQAAAIGRKRSTPSPNPVHKEP